MEDFDLFVGKTLDMKNLLQQKWNTF